MVRPSARNVAVSRKPNSVPLRGDDHSSSPAIAGGIKRPTRRLGRAVRTNLNRRIERRVSWAPPYLVLLRAGFCLPPVLPRARCALTAPFHPYPRRVLRRRLRAVYFLCHYPSSCPDRALPGALPCGVRTFLPPSPCGLSGRSSG